VLQHNKKGFENAVRIEKKLKIKDWVVKVKIFKIIAMNQFEIKFGIAKSKNYNQAIKLASGFENFKVATDQEPLNTIIIFNQEVLDKYSLIDQLLMIIKTWKSTQILYNGNSVTPNYFYQYRMIIRCSNEFRKSRLQGKFCNIDEHFQGWGCKFLRSVKRHAEEYSYSSFEKEYWYHHGSFIDRYIWKIDKDAIRDEILKEVEHKKINVCPIFSKELLMERINLLPDEINILEEDGWSIEYDDQYNGGILENVASGIKYEKKDNFSASGQSRITINFGEMMDDSGNEKIKTQRYIPNISFEDIGGIDEIITQLREVVELPIKKPEYFKHLGIKPHRGILFYGKPGNGKTLLAKAIANDVKAHFIAINGPELISKWHGQSEENLRNIFKEARELSPSLIFFDEIDSIAQKRSDSESSRVDSRFVNQLLTLMDGIEDYNGVTVLASTNRLELIDLALLRPGRFDFKIEITNPDIIGCFQILKIACKKMPLDHACNLESIAEKLIGLSGAEINFVAKEAALNALRRTVNIPGIIKQTGNEETIDDLKVTSFDFFQAIKSLKNNL